MRIGLISCTKSKTSYPAPARELYSPSALFRGALSYLGGKADATYVLSAMYGLMTLDQIGQPYDLTLKHMSGSERLRWAQMVLGQIQERHGESLRGFTFEFHTGEAYRSELEHLLQNAGATCICPVAGMGIGERQGFYSTHGRVAVSASIPPAREPSRVPIRPAVRGQGKIHAHLWLAAALLHEAGHPSFTPSRLVEEVERQFGDTRPGVKTHAHAHCVASAPLNTTAIYNYLSRLETGELRLYRRGDAIHPSRAGGKTAPPQVDIPEELWELWRRWLP